eukprot:SAG22_NODE_3848_length_1504_cov_0.977936_2_plen_282_part_00
MRSYGTPTALPAGSPAGLSCGEISQAGGATRVRFEAQLAASGGGGGAGFQPVGTTELVWAIGPSAALTMHATRGAATVDLPAGTGSVGDDRLVLFYLHGGLMLVGWGTLLPFGVGLAGVRRWVGEKWFKLHRGVNVAGLLLAVAGWAVAIGRTKLHFNSAHAVLGTAVMLLGLCQPLGALCRGHPSDKTAQRMVWEVVHKMGGRLMLLAAALNIYLGLSVEMLGASSALIALGTGWAGLVACAAVALSVHRGWATAPTDAEAVVPGEKVEMVETGKGQGLP